MPAADRARTTSAGGSPPCWPAGLAPLGITAHAFDRHAPLGEPERRLLQSYLDAVAERVAPHLDDRLGEMLGQLIARESPQSLLAQPHLTMTWLSVLALGRKPGP